MQTNRMGLSLIVSLVALRVIIGMHFFREGVNKLRDPKPFSAGFFANAKGPLADAFHGLVWDADGLARLNLQATLDEWDQFRARVERHYGFDDNQRQRAERIQRSYENQLRDHLEAKADELREYRGNLERRDRYARDRQRQEVPSLLAQMEKIEAEIRVKKPPLVGPIDAWWQGMSRDLNALATPEQRSAGSVPLSKPGRRMLDSDTIDAFIPWFDATIGALLVMGLFTAPAALAGAAFLFSVALSQWPTAPGALPSWPQLIEGIGLLVVAAAGAGRYAGFDSVIQALLNRLRRHPAGQRDAAQPLASRPSAEPRPSLETRRRQGMHS